MIGVFVVSPENTVVAVRYLVTGDPVVLVRVASALGGQASDQSWVANIELQPVVSDLKFKEFTKKSQKFKQVLEEPTVSLLWAPSFVAEYEAVVWLT